MGKFQDLTGQKFGRLTVIEYINNSKWFCQCECGNTKVVAGKHLKDGSTQSCGCLRVEDLTGQKFDKLTVLKRVENYISPKGYERVKWECKCDCGNTITATSDCLKKGKTKSCGCLQKEKIEDLTGKKFNRLTPIKYMGQSEWLCNCDCGGKIIVRGSNLKNGRIKSCGCINKEKIVRTGEKEKRLYSIWNAIKTRCYNKNAIEYKNYGARGIIMCDEWLNDFTKFCNWSLQNGYDNNLSIDRIDVNGNYEPSNCRWATNIEQANNTRRNHIITYNNKTQSLADWCRELNLDYTIVSSRINRSKWTVEQAFETPVKNPIKMIEYKNETKPLTQWCEELNLHYGTISTRLQRDWSIEKVFETPIKSRH